MKSGIWFLAASGVIAAAFRVGSADERVLPAQQPPFAADSQKESLDYFSKTGQSATSEAASQAARSLATGNPSGATSRYVRHQGNAATAEQSRIKNYNRELFGEDPPSATPAPSATSATAPQVRTVTSRPAIPAQRVLPTGFDQVDAQPAVGQEAPPTRALPQLSPAGTARRVVQPQSLGQASGGRQPSDSPVIHAEFQGTQDGPAAGQIQQIRANEEQTGPAGLPVAPADSLNATVLNATDEPASAGVAGPKSSSPRRALDGATQSLTPRHPPQEAPAGPSLSAMALSAMATASSEFPTVAVKWVKHSEINVGQECRIDLVVKNTSASPAGHLDIHAYFPATIRLMSARPEPVDAQDHLAWHIDLLKAGEERTLEVTLVPSRQGQLPLRAEVRFSGLADAQFEAAEPLLQLTMKGPSSVMLGEPASQIVTVSNPGTGVARDVTVDVLVPEGLEHPRGERLAMEIGSLNPGESRTIRLTLSAVSGGSHPVQVRATAGTDLQQSATAVVEVMAPKLNIAVEGPTLRYLGRSTRYTVNVSNEGPAPTNNVRVAQKLADGFQFVRADKGGSFEEETKEIHWFVGRLDPGQSSSLNVHLTASQLGDFTQFFRATSEHGTQSDAVVLTRVEGAADLAMQIVDLEDPVEIGKETAFEIRVRNDGSKEARNVSVSCELPLGVELIDAKGPSPHVAENGIVVFKAFDALPPGKTAIYRIHLKGVDEGNHRYRARLTSDSIQEPLVLEELTRYYAD